MELEFKRDTSFRKQFFTAESFAHPAKMDAQLLLWIVERYTKPGEVILDPMAGMGTTMLACTVGRNVVLVELEEKFCKMCKSNWEKLSAMPQLGYEMGQCNIVQGDARQLEGLVDKCIFSPPYAEAHDTKNLGVGDGDRADLRAYSWLKEDNPDNISNLPYGQIDKIVTSPPYGDEPTAHAKYLQIREESGRDITRPSQRYAKYDSIITSPPYEGTMSGEHHSEEARAKEFGKLRKLGYKINPDSADVKVRAAVYSDSDSNIGNLKLDSYLQAMLQVYHQCHKVLKPEGLMILVTKNFIRDKQVIKLDEDTIKLCEQAGFSFIERHYRKLISQSFWRTIYQKKYPGVEKIEHEDVLVFKK